VLLFFFFLSFFFPLFLLLFFVTSPFPSIPIDRRTRCKLNVLPCMCGDGAHEKGRNYVSHAMRVLLAVLSVLRSPSLFTHLPVYLSPSLLVRAHAFLSPFSHENSETRRTNGRRIPLETTQDRKKFILQLQTSIVALCICVSHIYACGVQLSYVQINVAIIRQIHVC
jgi:hypothetical protein